MDAHIQAIEDKYANSTVSDDVSGRIFFEWADDMTLPYIVWSFPSVVPDDVFAQKGKQAIVQFSIFTALTAGKAAMTTIYNHLHALFDECSLTITGYRSASMTETNLVPTIDDITTPEGSVGVRQWNVDFDLYTEKT
jgi:hypothetical protein